MNTHQRTSPVNILPGEGWAGYFGPIMTREMADHYCNCLLNTIDWQQDVLVMFGKEITTKRKVAWYGDQPFQYTYSKATKTALPWTKELTALKSLIEKTTEETFNSALLNLYHNGTEGMGWHSDDEPDLLTAAPIASISFGAERKFSFKHKQTKQSVSLNLEHGSLLLMKYPTQHHWQHSLPPTRKTTEPRINITFRSIVTAKITAVP